EGLQGRQQPLELLCVLWMLAQAGVEIHPFTSLEPHGDLFHQFCQKRVAGNKPVGHLNECAHERPSPASSPNCWRNRSTARRRRPLTLLSVMPSTAAVSLVESCSRWRSTSTSRSRSPSC